MDVYSAVPFYEKCHFAKQTPLPKVIIQVRIFANRCSGRGSSFGKGNFWKYTGNR